MKNVFIFIFIIGFFASCQNKEATVENTSNLKVANAVKVPTSKKVVSSANDDLGIEITSTELKKGEEGCVSLKVNGFNSILGIQNSINWNPKELQYKGVRNFGLPSLNKSNFGETKLNEGKLIFLWFDMNVKGVSLTDGKVLFDLCFEALAKKGVESKVSITNNPTKIEVAGPKKKRLNLKSIPAIISIK